ncbi:MAG TPA: TlpA disulfide reductase family protein [Draconibacterium sp.]|nr:TlpA disulfide reductase family protein [Draconibacterium sp.]
MKITIFFLILLLLSIISHAQKCDISGKIEGMKNDTLTIMFLPLKHGETPIIGQVVCKDGKLNYEVTLAAPIPHLVRISSKKWDNWFSANPYPFNFEMWDINFFLNSGDKINFIAEPNPNGIFVKTFGNQINEQRNELLKTIFPLQTQFNSACLKFAAAKLTKDSLQIKKEIETVEKIDFRINAITINFIVKHPDWDYSAEALMRLPMDSCYKYYPTLSKKVQNSFFGNYAKDILYAVKTGDIAPSFSLPDQNGKTVSLSDFKGKYIVLEFWGTWCVYCIKDIPTMKQYFNEYKHKTAFVSIACRDSETLWKAAIAKHEMSWTNLLNNDEKLTRTYGIEGYPTKIIINPDGIVVGKFLGEGSEFYAEMDRLFKN